MQKQKSNDVYAVELNGMLIRKINIQSNINQLGNQIWKLKNERLGFQNDLSAMEKKIREKVIKNNNLLFTENTHEK